MMEGTGPAAHEAHELPLAWRIIDDYIGEYVETSCRTAALVVGDATEYERGWNAAVSEMRHLHLDGWDYKVTPKLVDALKRAGLLATDGSTDG